MGVNKPELKLRGVFTALVTPFTGDEVDYEALTKLVEAQIAAGVDGLVPCGTTGECPTLSHEEHDKVISTVVKVANKRVPIIAGTGSNCTKEAVRLTREAKVNGADAALVVNPYYNKPNQQGLFEHFSAIAAEGLPIVLYNIPGRTGITMNPDTVAKLYKEIPMIVAIKEATGSLDMSSEIASLCDIIILSGDDSLTLPLISVGASGVISVSSNIMPEVISKLTTAALEGRIADSRAIHVEYFEFLKTMFMEPNPQPIKYAMTKVGALPSAAVRLPLVECSESTKQKVDVVLKKHNLA